MKKLFFLFFIVSASVFSQNMILVNQTFKNGMSGWDSGVWGEGSNKPVATFEAESDGHNDNSSIKIKVKQNTKKGTGEKAFLKYPNLKLKKGKRYTVSFWIKSKFYDDEILVKVYSAPDTGSKKAWGAVVDRSFPFVGDGKWHQISHTFTAKGLYDMPVDMKNVALYFGFDKRKGSFWVDDVSFRKE